MSALISCFNLCVCSWFATWTSVLIYVLVLLQVWEPSCTTSGTECWTSMRSNSTCPSRPTSPTWTSRGAVSQPDRWVSLLLFLSAVRARNLFIKFSPARRPLSARARSAHIAIFWRRADNKTRHQRAFVFICVRRKANILTEIYLMRWYTHSDWANIEFLLRQFILMQLSDILVGMNFFWRRLWIGSPPRHAWQVFEAKSAQFWNFVWVFGKLSFIWNYAHFRILWRGICRDRENFAFYHQFALPFLVCCAHGKKCTMHHANSSLEQLKRTK